MGAANRPAASNSVRQAFMIVLRLLWVQHPKRRIATRDRYAASPHCDAAQKKNGATLSCFALSVDQEMRRACRILCRPGERQDPYREVFRSCAVRVPNDGLRQTSPWGNGS